MWIRPLVETETRRSAHWAVSAASMGVRSPIMRRAVPERTVLRAVVLVGATAGGATFGMGGPGTAFALAR